MGGSRTEKQKLRRKKKAEQKHGVSGGDTARLSALLAKGRILSDMPALADTDSILMKDTCLQKTLFICHPQQRNIYGHIFGGFLMRRAYELAFLTAYSFAGAAPHFLEVDFFKPVSIKKFIDVRLRYRH